MRGFRQFDAPVSVIGCIDRDLIDSTEAYFDLGQFVYAMVIAAWDRGVGAVINGQGIYQSSVVREEASIPEDQLIVITVAMGFPAEDFPAKTMSSQSAALSRKLPLTTAVSLTDRKRPAGSSRASRWQECLIRVGQYPLVKGR